MDAKLLMIGDYIQFSREHSSPLPPKPVQVFGIRYDGEISHIHLLNIVFCESGAVQYNYNPDIFEGIPLTPEVLEKIGFKDVSNHTLKGCSTYQLSFGKYNDQRLIYKLGDYFAYESYGDRWYRLFETQLCYKWCVHHLQQTLRICGINIDFKL